MRHHAGMQVYVHVHVHVDVHIIIAQTTFQCGSFEMSTVIMPHSLTVSIAN